MLLGPQGFEKVGDPAVDRPEPVEPRVAGPAEGDQGVGAMGGPAVVDDQRRGGLADAAQVMVAGQDPFPAPAEAGPRAAAAVVAEFTQTAAVEIPGPAGAAKRQLGVRSHGVPAVQFSPTIIGIIITKNEAKCKAECRASLP